MKGYFSQLARHTGLSFESGKTSAASGPLTPPIIAAQRAERTETAPLHVEQITFGAPSNPAAAGLAGRSNKDLTDFTAADAAPLTPASRSSVELFDHATRSAFESRHDDNQESAPETPPHPATDVSPQNVEESQIHYTTLESTTPEPQEHSAEKQIPASQPGIVRISKERSQAGRKSGPAETFEGVETVESVFARHEHEGPYLSASNQRARAIEEDQERLQLPRVVERPNEALGEQLEWEVTFQNYLKEVRAWVAATPETDERGLGHQSRPGVPPERNRSLFALEQEINTASSPLHGQGQESAVQDLSLSIGTISIVVEEPKTKIPVPPPPTRAERTAERITSEPTSLSRYYLRSW